MINLLTYQIKLIPFSLYNFATNEKDIIAKVINYRPVNDAGVSLIVKNEKNATYNETGFTAICIEIMDHEIIKIQTGEGDLYGKIEGVTSAYFHEADFYFGEKVETKNGTYRQGKIYSIHYHINDQNFRFKIKSEDGKKVKREYKSVDLKKI